MTSDDLSLLNDSEAEVKHASAKCAADGMQVLTTAPDPLPHR